MAYPRSARRREEMPQRPRIDARAARRDLNGNVISEPGEMAFTKMHRGMDGKPDSGESIGRGTTMQFPARKSGLDGLRPLADAPAQRQGPLPDGGTMDTTTTPSGFPRSRMTTGNAGVEMRGAEERGAQMAPAASRTAFPRPGTGANIMRQPDGSPGGLITAAPGGGRDLSSVYGTGSLRFPQPPGLAKQDMTAMPRHSALLPTARVRPRAEADALAAKLERPEPQPPGLAKQDMTAMPRHSALLPTARVRPRAEADALAAKLNPASGFPKKKKRIAAL